MELSLGTIDLSSLETLEEGPAGAAEADATRSGEVRETEDTTEIEFLDSAELLSRAGVDAGNELGAEQIMDAEELSEDEGLANLEPETETGQASDVEEAGLPGQEFSNFIAYMPPERYFPSGAFSYSGGLEELSAAPEAEDSASAVEEALETETIDALEDAEIVSIDEDREDAESIDDIEELEADLPIIPIYEDDAVEEVEGPIVYRDGLFRVEEEYTKRPLALDIQLRDLVNEVLAPGSTEPATRDRGTEAPGP